MNAILDFNHLAEFLNRVGINLYK